MSILILIIIAVVFFSLLIYPILKSRALRVGSIFDRIVLCCTALIMYGLCVIMVWGMFGILSADVHTSYTKIKEPNVYRVHQYQYLYNDHRFKMEGNKQSKDLNGKTAVKINNKYFVDQGGK